MRTDHNIRARLAAAADPMRIPVHDALDEFHRARPRRQAIRRAATIVTALGVAAVAFAATWLGTPFGERDGTPATPTGPTTVTSEPSGRISYSVVVDDGDQSSLAMSVLGDETRSPIDVPSPFSAYPVWSPDGSMVAYGGGDDYGSIDVTIVAADGSDPRTVEELGGPGLSWSPDGTMLAYVGPDDGDGFDAVRIVGADGQGDRVVLPGTAWESVSWSSDGQRLLVAGHPPSPDNVAGPEDWDIYSVALDGSDVRPLTDTVAYEHAVSWSPDGSKILFARSDYSDDADYDQDIWVMDADGSEAERITDWRGFDGFPTWSPDGTWILFASDRDATPDQQQAFRRGDAFGGVSLFVMRSDGTDVRRVITAADDETLLPGSWKAA